MCALRLVEFGDTLCEGFECVTIRPRLEINSVVGETNIDVSPGAVEDFVCGSDDTVINIWVSVVYQLGCDGVPGLRVMLEDSSEE